MLEKRMSMPRISKKYSFAMIAILLQICVLFLVHYFQFSEKLSIFSVVSTQLVILITTVSYVTGEAKIDIQAIYGGKNQIPEMPNPFKKMVDTLKEKDPL